METELVDSVSQRAQETGHMVSIMFIPALGWHVHIAGEEKHFDNLELALIFIEQELKRLILGVEG